MFKDPIRILNIYQETISDGDGFRYSIYFSGCKHHCKGCHNPDSWNPDAGNLLTEKWFEKIIKQINENPLLDGITLSGGDPFYYPETLLVILKKLKEKTHKNIWCYTGYTYDQLMKKEDYKACLDYIDVLVDGRFIEEQLSPSSAFIGSSNQHIIKLK